MRIGLLGACLVFLISGSVTYSLVVTEDFHPALDQQTLSAEETIPERNDHSTADSFVIESARWIGDDRTLLVRARTAHEKGTLLTLTGLPESTMLDTFRISAEHSVEYRLPLAKDEAPPCRVLVKSAFASETVKVMDAPSACQSLLQISGSVALSPLMPMANGWVTVTVDDVVFATIADKHGDYALEVYNDSSNAIITIIAEGIVDDRESVVHIYSGSIDNLPSADNLSASAWAVEIYGRKHSPLLLAAATD
jgi:hypothetical protein